VRCLLALLALAACVLAPIAAFVFLCALFGAAAAVIVVLIVAARIGRARRRG
jgi:hypothetical protein